MYIQNKQRSWNNKFFSHISGKNVSYVIKGNKKKSNNMIEEPGELFVLAVLAKANDITLQEDLQIHFFYNINRT
jgi:hypothetical protein